MKNTDHKKLEQDASIKMFQLDDGFKSIFTHKELHSILQEDIKSFPLWYHCMNHFIITSKEINTIQKEEFLKSQNIFHFLRRIKLYIKQSLGKKDKDKLDVLFISRDRFIEIRTIEGIIKSDYLFYSSIHYLHKNHPHIKIGLLSNINNPPDGLNVDIFTLQRYVPLTALLKSIFFATKKRVQWKYYKNKILKNVNEDNYTNTSIASLTNSFFNFKSLLYYFINDNSYHNAFNKLKPKLIVSNDDLMELKPNYNYNNLKFITIQSASMSRKNEYYRRLFISEFGSDKIKSDYFLCTGIYFKALKEFSKTAKKVVVTSQPRYDILYHADKIYDRTKIMRDLGLNSNKKMVLWTTETHGLSLEENVKNIKAVYNAMASLKDVQLVIKLHPEEDQKAPRYKKDKSFNPVIVDGKADTYALLYACDLMVTRHSTTAMEAVALNKPVIILNLSGEPDPVEYVKEGVALGVYKPEDLKLTIEKLLKDDSELAKNRGEYIEKYLYKIDGNATKRVVSLIEEMIEESRRKKNEI